MKSFTQFINEEDDVQQDTVDTVTVDVPLLIRLLEYAREDAKTDMDLHDVATKMVKAAKGKSALTMSDYENLIGKND
jgi:hypothetical protein